MIIAVDFDGTIVEHKYPMIGKERPFAIDTLKQLAQEGHTLILWTVREGKSLEEAVEFCRERGLEFYSVNSNFPEQAWAATGGRKLKADLFIDDCNLGGIPEWDEIYQMITDKSAKQLKSSSSASRRKHHRHSKPNIFKRIVERTRAAREKFDR